MFKILLGSVIVILLSSCGGGGSSSSGGNNPLAGTYSGNHTVVFSGAISTTDVVFLTLTVNGDGSFRITDGDGGAGSIAAVGNLNGDKFNATGSGGDTIDNVTCNFTVNYAGTIANNAAKGADTGSGTCRFQNRNLSINISGQFDLPKTSNAKAPGAGTLMSKVAALLK